MTRVIDVVARKISGRRMRDGSRELGFYADRIFPKVIIKRRIRTDVVEAATLE